jgi:hypothetical protein
MCRTCRDSRHGAPGGARTRANNERGDTLLIDDTDPAMPAITGRLGERVQLAQLGGPDAAHGARYVTLDRHERLPGPACR